MRIDLKWLDKNKLGRHSTEVYRSQVPFADISDATLLATVPPGITEYSDADVVYRRTYYYRLRFVDPPRRPALSELFEFRASSYTGPGATAIIFGDDNFGYFGKISPQLHSSPTIPDVQALFGITPSENFLAEMDLHKFAIGGSVRCMFQYPIGTGKQIPRDHPIMANLISGGAHYLEYGLHRWAMILPSANHVPSNEGETKRFPGELRSMLGVTTNMYTRIEDVQYGNQTGDRLNANSGIVDFPGSLEALYPGQDLKYIISTDWYEPNKCEVVNWTPSQTVYPVRPNELHVLDVDFTDPTEWDKVLLWPVFVYLGLIGPQ